MKQVDQVKTIHVGKIFIVCDQSNTAPIWEYILGQQGLSVILETSLERSIDQWSRGIHDLAVIDVTVSPTERLELCRKFRSISIAPLLLFLPAHHEIEILDAYAAGVDDVVIKPLSPAIFLAKVTAWMRRTWTVPVDGLNLVKAGKHRLDPVRRCIVDPMGQEIKLTNLEFRLLHLLMTRPAHVFSVENIIQAIWGGYGDGDQILLKNVVYRLRRKIEADPSRPVLLQTGPGGYLFQE